MSQNEVKQQINNSNELIIKQIQFNSNYRVQKVFNNPQVKHRKIDNIMQQLEFVKQKLQIREFPQIKTKELGTLRAPEVILFFLLINLIFGLMGITFLTYLTLGFAIPAICRYKDIKIFNYWQCLALLLYFRNFSNSFASLDGFLLVFLWHPSFKGAQKFIQWIKSFKTSGHIDKGVNEIKKFL